jgi:hypothetical protein
VDRAVRLDGGGAGSSVCQRSGSPTLVVRVPRGGGWPRGAHQLQIEAAEGLSWPGDKEPRSATKVLVERRNGVRGGFESRNGCGGDWQGHRRLL